MSDKVAVMFDGKVEQVASPRELYERPASQRVASFIGAMNFIDGKVIEAKDEIKINSDILGALTVSRSQVFGNLAENKITLGIRPERISIVSNDSSIAGSIFGKITDASYFGETTYYKVTCGKKSETLTVSAQNSFGQMDYKIGEQVKLNVDDKSLVGFLD